MKLIAGWYEGQLHLGDPNGPETVRVFNDVSGAVVSQLPDLGSMRRLVFPAFHPLQGRWQRAGREAGLLSIRRSRQAVRP